MEKGVLFNMGEDKIITGVTGLANNVRGFMVYDRLHEILEEYVEWGDGYHSVAVFDEDVYTDSDLIDGSVINLMKLLSTAFGLSHVNEAVAIVNALQRDGSRKKTMRFRSKHPLFANGTPLYQNVCLVSGMIHMEIPIQPYFDGRDLLIDMDDSIHIDVERMVIDDYERRKKS